MSKFFNCILEMVFYYIVTIVIMASLSTAITAIMLPKNPPSEPSIIGDADFRKDIKDTLLFLKTHSPQDYEQICKYIRTVRLYNKENSSAYAFGIVFYSKSSYLAAKKIQANPKYYPTYPIARTLIHESVHCKQSDREPATMALVGVCLFAHINTPIAYLTEKEALEAEQDFLARMGAPRSVINDVAGYNLLNDKWWLTAK